MTKYLNGIDISDYYEGQVGRICDYFKSQGTPLSIAQVEITAGTYNDTEIYNTLSVIKDVVNNGLKLGYYAFLYPEKPGDSPIRQQAIAFTNVYTSIKNQYGITPDCKIMIDVEETGFSQIHVQPSTEQVTFMINTFADTVDSILGKQEYVVYSSASFITSYFGEIDTERFGLIVSSTPPGLFDMEQINYPTGNYTPINYDLYPNNWGSNWTGVQFSFGGKQDYDIYKDNILLGDKNPTKIPTKKEAIFYPNEYVKLQKNCSVFAPNKIPESNKGKDFIIDKIEGEKCYLKGLSESVFENELKKEQQSTSKPKSNINENKNWQSLDIITKTAIFIASNEGFDPGAYQQGINIGYSTSIYPGLMNGFTQPISRMDGIEIVKRWVENNIVNWNNWINEGGLNINELSDNQKIALYDFGYNTGGGAGLLNQLSNCIDTRSDTFHNTFGSFLLVSNPKDQLGIDNRRMAEYKMYFNGPSFGGAINELPEVYYNIVKSM